MDKLDATVLLYTVRSRGVARAMECLAQQDYTGSWEFVLVDGCFGERNEVLTAFWRHLRPDVPLVHVPPLPPIGRSFYYHDEVLLFQYSGWCYARGKHVVQTEDAYTFRPTWLSTHMKFLSWHTNMMSLGDLRDGDVDDLHADESPQRYGLPDALTAQCAIAQTCQSMLAAYQNPKLLYKDPWVGYKHFYICNTGFPMEHILAASPFDELPSHYPEGFSIKRLTDYGIIVWPIDKADAWHGSHGQNIDRVWTDPLGLTYIPFDRSLEVTSAPTVQRDIVAERKRLGRWV